MYLKRLRCGTHLNYPMSRGVLLMRRWGWDLLSHVVIIGPLGFAVIWRKKLVKEP